MELLVICGIWLWGGFRQNYYPMATNQDECEECQDNIKNWSIRVFGRIVMMNWSNTGEAAEFWCGSFSKEKEWKRGVDVWRELGERGWVRAWGALIIWNKTHMEKVTECYHGWLCSVLNTTWFITDLHRASALTALISVLAYSIGKTSALLYNDYEIAIKMALSHEWKIKD